MTLLEGKKIILGVTASVAIYKALELIRLFQREGACVYVIMTESATRLVDSQLFEAISGNRVFVRQFAKEDGTDFSRFRRGKSLYDDNFRVRADHKEADNRFGRFPHLDIIRKADVFLVAPATADILGKAANGFACDLLSTSLLGFGGPILFAPAMNVSMWNNRIVQDNVRKLRDFGMTIIDVESGELACGDMGSGRLASLWKIFDAVLFSVSSKDLCGKNILVTAGPTREKIDDVRFISNGSTGNMGYILARSAFFRGADVTLVTGPTSLFVPEGVRRIDVVSAAQMYSAVDREFPKCDVFFSVAAVSDFRVSQARKGKIHKREIQCMEFEKTEDIVAGMSKKKKSGQKVIGFSLDCEDFEKNATEKLRLKSLDMIISNSLESLGSLRAHFSLVTRSGVSKLGMIHKAELSDRILGMVSQGD